MNSEPTPTPEPELLNDRQRKFVEELARGKNAQDAARGAGYSPGYVRKASRLLRQPIIAKAVAEIREQGRALAAYDLAAAMKEAQSAADFSRQNKNSMALVKATELRAKLSGLLIDKVEVVPPVDLRNALLEARTRIINVATIMSTKLLTEGNGTVGGAGSPKESN